jgi:hypothetical protein
VVAGARYVVKNGVWSNFLVLGKPAIHLIFAGGANPRREARSNSDHLSYCLGKTVEGENLWKDFTLVWLAPTTGDNNGAACLRDDLQKTPDCLRSENVIAFVLQNAAGGVHDSINVQEKDRALMPMSRWHGLLH